jgi:hypothetical protein
MRASPRPSIEKTSRVDFLARQDSRPRDGFFVGAMKGLLTIFAVLSTALKRGPALGLEAW